MFVYYYFGVNFRLRADLQSRKENEWKQEELKMNETKELTVFDKALIGTIPFTLVLSVVLYFVTKNANSEVKSLVVGASLSLILNAWNYHSTMKIGTTDYRQLRVFSTFSFFLRGGLMIALILVACLLSNYNAIYIVFGYFEYPLFLSIFSLMQGKEAGKNV